MNDIRRAALFLILIFQVLIWGCSKAPFPTEGNGGDKKITETSGKIIISATNYAGETIDSAYVFWNCQFLGYTPLTYEKVPIGTHALRIQKSGFEIYSESIPIEDNRSVFVEALLKRLPLNKGQLLITIDQDSAISILANSQNGVVDLFYSREKSFVLDPGGYFLKTEKPGYQMVYVALEVKADSVMIKNIRLEKIDNPELPEIALAVPDSGLVNEPILISWESNKAEKIDIDYIENPGLSGKREIIFSIPGMRYIRAIARNGAGATTVVDSVFIFKPETPPGIAPDLEFSIIQDSVEYEQPVVVSWKSNGYQVIIDQGIGVRGPSGTEEIMFLNPGLKTFTAVAYSENGLMTIKKDQVLVKDPLKPKLPIVALAMVDSVQVGLPFSVEWQSQNANQVDVDYVQNPGLNGKAEIIFQSAGRRIISATAYNQEGLVTVVDTVEVVSVPPSLPQVNPIMITANAKVGAIHPQLSQVINNIGPATVTQEGYYRVSATVWYNSGDDQKNESFFIVISDEFNRKIYPKDPNAGSYKVVPDDPGAPHTAVRDAGLFYLGRGQVAIDLHHYYTISKQYPQFIVDGPINDAESVEVISFKLEYYQP